MSATMSLGGREARRRFACTLAGSDTHQLGAAPLADLLPPHRIVESLLFDKLAVASRFDDAAALENVDAVCVQNRGQPVCNQHGDRIAAGSHIANRVDD